MVVLLYPVSGACHIRVNGRRVFDFSAPLCIPWVVFGMSLLGLARYCRRARRELFRVIVTDDLALELLRVSARLVGMGCHGWQRFGSARCSS